MNIYRSTYYRAQHCTGPACVLVSIQFGITPTEGPRIVRLLVKDKDTAIIQFDVDRHVSEILVGVSQANAELGGQLEVEAIEVVPDDYPGKGQAQHVAYQIALAVLGKEV